MQLVVELDELGWPLSARNCRISDYTAFTKIFIFLRAI